MAGRRLWHYIGEIAVEAFITGLFWQAGESLVTEAVKVIKRRRREKRRQADECPPDPNDPEA